MVSVFDSFGRYALVSLVDSNRYRLPRTRTTTSETNARTIFVLLLERVRLFFVLVRSRGHRLRRFPRRLDGFQRQTTMLMMPFRQWTMCSRQRRLSRADRARRGERHAFRHGSVDFPFFKQPLAFPWGLFFCALVFSRVGGRLGCRAFVSNRRSVPKFFVRVNREMSLREKSETTFCVKTLFIKRPLPFFKRPRMVFVYE